jgi:hypothetical protein
MLQLHLPLLTWVTPEASWTCPICSQRPLLLHPLLLLEVCIFSHV